MLGCREHSRAELQRKLGKYEEEPGQLVRVLDELHAKGFLSEQRVVDSVLHRRAQRLGAGRIRQELQAKGIDGELVAQALHQLRGTEVARAREVWKRKFDAPPQDASERGRQSRFLAARGFGGDVIQRVLGSSGEDD